MVVRLLVVRHLIFLEYLDTVRTHPHKEVLAYSHIQCSVQFQLTSCVGCLSTSPSHVAQHAGHEQHAKRSLSAHARVSRFRAKEQRPKTRSSRAPAQDWTGTAPKNGMVVSAVTFEP